MNTKNNQNEGELELLVSGSIKRVKNHRLATEMEKLRYVDFHNICAYLETTEPEAKEYKTLIKNLKRCRIFKAITVNPKISSDHVREFWKNTRLITDGEQEDCIRSKVNNRTINVSETVIRRVFEFGDAADDPTEIPKDIVERCYRKMGYEGRFPTIKKTLFSSNWRYLLHIMVHCLCNKKAGTDSLNANYAAAAIALILNKPFNFSRLIFNGFKDNLKETKKGDRFLLFPRFVQQIIKVQHPDLQVTGTLLELRSMTKAILVTCGKKTANSKFTNKKSVLFGYFAGDDAYVLPETDEEEAGPSDSVVVNAPFIQSQREISSKQQSQQAQRRKKPTQEQPPQQQEQPPQVEEQIQENVEKVIVDVSDSESSDSEIAPDQPQKQILPRDKRKRRDDQGSPPASFFKLGNAESDEDYSPANDEFQVDDEEPLITKKKKIVESNEPVTETPHTPSVRISGDEYISTLQRIDCTIAGTSGAQHVETDIHQDQTKVLDLKIQMRNMENKMSENYSVITSLQTTVKEQTEEIKGLKNEVNDLKKGIRDLISLLKNRAC